MDPAVRRDSRCVEHRSRADDHAHPEPPQAPGRAWRRPASPARLRGRIQGRRRTRPALDTTSQTGWSRSVAAPCRSRGGTAGRVEWRDSRVLKRAPGRGPLRGRRRVRSPAGGRALGERRAALGRPLSSQTYYLLQENLQSTTVGSLRILFWSDVAPDASTWEPVAAGRRCPIEKVEVFPGLWSAREGFHANTCGVPTHGVRAMPVTGRSPIGPLQLSICHATSQCAWPVVIGSITCPRSRVSRSRRCRRRARLACARADGDADDLGVQPPELP